MLRRRETKDRLWETCFEGSEVARTVFQLHLKRFTAQGYRMRWGTVADAILKLTQDVRASLVWGWSLKKYLAGSSRHAAMTEHAKIEGDAEAEEFATRLDVVNDVIPTYFWWSYWDMLKRISSVLQRLLVWAESCACHYDLLQKLCDDDLVAEAGIDKSERDAALRACRTCPMRGRRCPEIACGDVVELAKDLLHAGCRTIFGAASHP